MKTILTTVCLIILLATHSEAQEATKNLAIHWIALLNQHDSNAIAQLYDVNATLESPNWEGIKTGRAEAKTVYSRYFQSTPDLRFDITNIISTDTAAVVEYRSSGTFRKPEPSTPDYMKGKKYVLLNCTRLDIRNGKIIKQVNYFDQVSFLRQMGFFDRK